MKLVKIALTEINNSCNFSFEDKKVTPEVVETIQKDLAEKLFSMIVEAKKNGVDAVFLNELCNAPYFPVSQTFNRQWLKFAINIENSLFVKRLISVSGELNMLIIAPVYEIDSEGKYYNTAIVIDRGEMIGIMRKTHVPFGKNEKGVFAEGYYYIANSDSFMNIGRSHVIDTYSSLFPVFQTSIGRVGINICYGRHFPENWKVLSKNGAEIVFCPAVTFGEVSQRIWKQEFAVNSVWNNLFICASNRTGSEFEDKNSPEFFGDSCFFDPSGKQVEPFVNKFSEKNQIMIFKIDKRMRYHNYAGWNLVSDQRDVIVKATLNKNTYNLPVKNKQKILKPVQNNTILEN